MAIHLFVDTNIYLNFYHFSNDDIDSLARLRKKIDDGVVVLHLPKHVVNEWERNRETKLKIAADEFNKTPFQAQIPRHMMNLAMASQYTEAIAQAKKARDILIVEATAAARTYRLDVDEALIELYTVAQMHEEDDAIYARGRMRAEKGNPPGKAGSVGDQYNWEMLLDRLPEEDLYVVSKDGDFASPLRGSDENGMTYPNSFIQNEWKQFKKTDLYVFDSIKAFLLHHDKAVRVAERVVEVAAAAGDEDVVEELPIEEVRVVPGEANDVPPVMPAVAENEVLQLGELGVEPEVVSVDATLSPESREEKRAAIEALTESESFQTTHRAIAALRDFEGSLTKADANALAEAVVNNDQIRWIIDDTDVNQFYLRLLSRQIAELEPAHVSNLTELLNIGTSESTGSAGSPSP